MFLVVLPHGQHAVGDFRSQLDRQGDGHLQLEVLGRPVPFPSIEWLIGLTLVVRDVETIAPRLCLDRFAQTESVGGDSERDLRIQYIQTMLRKHQVGRRWVVVLRVGRIRWGTAFMNSMAACRGGPVSESLGTIGIGAEHVKRAPCLILRIIVDIVARIQRHAGYGLWILSLLGVGGSATVHSCGQDDG